MLLDLLRDQVPYRNFCLFLFGISPKFDDLHSVSKSPGNRVDPVSRRHKKYFRQIERSVDIVVAESRILFRVKDFQKSRRGVSPLIATQLVNFVQDNNWIVGTSSLDSLNNLTRKSTNIGSTMSTYLGFVSHSTKRHSGVFSSHGIGNRATQRSLSHARRSHKAQNRLTDDTSPFHLPYGQKFNNSVLNLLKSKMVAIQNFHSMEKIEIVDRCFIPR